MPTSAAIARWWLRRSRWQATTCRPRLGAGARRPPDCRRGSGPRPPAPRRSSAVDANGDHRCAPARRSLRGTLGVMGGDSLAHSSHASDPTRTRAPWTATADPSSGDAPPTNSGLDQRPLLRGAATIARASGCSEACSSEPASSRACVALDRPLVARTSTTAAYPGSACRSCRRRSFAGHECARATLRRG